jgi:hypothetical protein
MKWIGITGSWKKTSTEVESDVRGFVREVIERGDGIVTGGALNVDYQAIDEALTHNPSATQIKVIIPATLERYATHYRKRAEEGVITREQAELLIDLLARLQLANSEALIMDQDNTVIDKTTYYERNTRVVEAADELMAFQVNDSGGVQDTIDKARLAGKPVQLKKYLIGG